MTSLIHARWHAGFSGWARETFNDGGSALAAVVWGPTGCGKTFGVRRLLEATGRRIVEIDGDDTALRTKEERTLLIQGVLSSPRPCFVLIDDADSHEAAAGQLLDEFLAVAGRAPQRQHVPARLVFVGDDRYVPHCRRLSLPRAGRVLQIDARRHARADLLRFLRAPPYGLLPAAAGPLLDAAHGDVRVLLALAASGGRALLAPADFALQPHETARDLLNVSGAPSRDAVDAVVARTNADLVASLVSDSWPAAFGAVVEGTNADDALEAIARVADAWARAGPYDEGAALHETAACLAELRMGRPRTECGLVTTRKRARPDAALATMATAGARNVVDELHRAGRLVGVEDRWGNAANAGYAWRRREWLVARGIVEPWGGPGALPSPFPGISGTGVISQATTFDPLNAHVPQIVTRRNASASATGPPTPVPGTPRRPLSSSSSDLSRGPSPGATRQLTLPRMFGTIRQSK